MKAKHTPGPWYALRGQRNISIRHKTGDRLLPMVNVASVRGQFPTDCPYGSSEANARLIAAAPELLDALIALLSVAPSKAPGAGLIVGAEEKHANALQAARAAIKKATGDA